MTDVYRIAGTGIQITSVSDKVHRALREYRAPDAPVDLFVETTREDIVFERRRTAENEAYEGTEHRMFDDAYYEFLAVYRKISEAMPFRGVCMMHGSCIAVDGNAYLFTAKSGTGKSTHSRLWREMLQERAVMVNDDKPMIGVSDAAVIAYGTPWDGKHHLSADIAVPLKAICILECAAHNRIREISAAEAYPMLLQQVYRPLNGEAMRQTLNLIDRISASVRFYRLECNMDPEAAKVSYEAMKG